VKVKSLVFNSTPLIYLTKAGLSRIFEGMQGEKLTSPAVKREVVDEGKRKGIPDAIVLDKLFANGVLKVCEPVDEKFLVRLLETQGLHLADAEVLALAHELAGIAVVDDAVARKTAKVYGIDYVGSPYVLMRAVCEGLISKVKAKQAVNDMFSAGWRCNVETYVKIMEALEKL
jgi:predicted nucleic acid-binding protein